MGREFLLRFISRVYDSRERDHYRRCIRDYINELIAVPISAYSTLLGNKKEYRIVSWCVDAYLRDIIYRR